MLGICDVVEHVWPLVYCRKAVMLDRELRGPDSCFENI